jgi:GTP cyclohydrolase I
MCDEQKVEMISRHFRDIMEILGLDLRDDSLRGTPARVAKMYVKEIFSGLDPKNFPSISLFDNKYKYQRLLLEKEIKFTSVCEHHFLPIPGLAHVGYIPAKKVIGLSKINRIVKYFAQRPQVQERLTRQIFEKLRELLCTDDIIVVLCATHMCVSMRGIEDPQSNTSTLFYGGIFEQVDARREFLEMINIKSHG